MKPLLLVDGYNVIGAWELPAKKHWTFDESRSRLEHLLQEYAAFHDWETVLVFDGTKTEKLVRTQIESCGLKTVYTRHGETADQYIERCCDEQPRHRQIHVATSDGVEQTVVMGRGAVRVTARELLLDMAKVHTQQQKMLTEPIVRKNLLIDRLPPEQAAIFEKMRRQK